MVPSRPVPQSRGTPWGSIFGVSRQSLEKPSDKSLWRPWDTVLGGTKGPETALPASLGPFPELRNGALLELSDSF
jgi:hypothetical protein